MPRLLRILSLVLVVACAGTLPACSFSKSARQQRAYQKYVRKSSMGRVKQSQRFKKGKTKMPTAPAPSEPMQSSESGPQAIPAQEKPPEQSLEQQ